MLEFSSVDLSSPKDPNKYGECKLYFSNYELHACKFLSITVYPESLTKTISVQSSYKLHLPPYLLIHSANIKLSEPIGQGTPTEKHAENSYMRQ